MHSVEDGITHRAGCGVQVDAERSVVIDAANTARWILFVEVREPRNNSSRC